MSDESIKEFVRKRLGCDCSEDVFRHIVDEKGVDVGGITLNDKINIGNRLLVYIVGADGAGFPGRVPALVRAGKEERDANGFNRFRLVVVTDDNKLKKAVFDAFKALPWLDEKIHLHVIGKKDKPGF